MKNRSREQSDFARRSSVRDPAVIATTELPVDRGEPLLEAAPSVLVLLPDGELRNRCLAALSDLAAGVWQAWSAVPDDVVLDVVVVSPRSAPASGHGGGDFDGVPLDGGCDPLGVVQIGGEGPADVVLPESFSPRELALACRLLSSVVRLRRQVQEGRQTGRRLREEALGDSLTGLPNRRAWDEELSQRIAAAQSQGQPLCLAVVDLDHFKQVNDGWGHAAGDRLLQAAAGALKQSLRQDDFVARLGGDEFGLLLAGLDAEAAASVIERLRSGLPARIAQATPYVTSISIGYTLWQGSGPCTAESLAKGADAARRQAKCQGRDRAVRGG
jgi:diguanylate cyclase (GGDEF)-like protein